MRFNRQRFLELARPELAPTCFGTLTIASAKAAIKSGFPPFLVYKLYCYFPD